MELANGLIQSMRLQGFSKTSKLSSSMENSISLLRQWVPQDPAFLVNLSDYVDASKPSVVSLPLLGCDSGATLHVTVQLLTSKTGFREFEQQRELSGRGLQVGPDQNGPDQSYSGKVSVSEEIVNNRIDNSFIEEYRLQDMFLLSKSVILRCMISLLQENCLQILPGSVQFRSTIKLWR
ncbi:uncharacterized protein LOC108458352 [Gossypium arboreum]|uniref:uncharacterized protein LOC108458352 n=1 Tax=Gossypium arboreum TaxID=29729 RepID=UPI0008191DAC|nr:uncharacterized protein LOC108458352 [Gossypium arboreum]XP_017613198.1 uncharacterized protein LOC108458352 [Gossypium arboreum]